MLSFDSLDNVIPIWAFQDIISLFHIMNRELGTVYGLVFWDTSDIKGIRLCEYDFFWEEGTVLEQVNSNVWNDNVPMGLYSKFAPFSDTSREDHCLADSKNVMFFDNFNVTFKLNRINFFKFRVPFKRIYGM